MQQTEKVMKNVEEKVRKLPEVKTLMILLGRNANVSWTAAESYENSAVLNIRVQGKDLRLVEENCSENPHHPGSLSGSDLQDAASQPI